MSNDLVEARCVVELYEQPERMGWWATLDNGLAMRITMSDLFDRMPPRYEMHDDGRLRPINVLRQAEIILGLPGRD